MIHDLDEVMLPLRGSDREISQDGGRQQSAVVTSFRSVYVM